MKNPQPDLFAPPATPRPVSEYRASRLPRDMLEGADGAWCALCLADGEPCSWCHGTGVWDRYGAIVDLGEPSYSGVGIFGLPKDET